MKTIISVNVATERQWPNGNEIDNRNAAIQELADRNVGNFLWAGKGVRGMDFAFEVHDVRAARGIIAKAMFNHLPGWKYAVETAPANDVNMHRLNSKHGLHAGQSIANSNPELSTEAKHHTLLAVNIEVRDTKASQRELAGQAAIIKELDARDAGKFLKAGTSMGGMDIAYEVEHENFSRARFGLIIEKHLPGYQFTMHTKPMAPSKDFATAAYDRRRIKDRRHEPKGPQQGVQHGFGMGR